MTQFTNALIEADGVVIRASGVITSRGDRLECNLIAEDGLADFVNALRGSHNFHLVRLVLLPFLDKKVLLEQWEWEHGTGNFSFTAIMPDCRYYGDYNGV